MRCFFCETDFAKGLISADKLESSELNHIFKVLRAKSGTELLLNNGKGSLAQAIVLNKLEFEITKVMNFEKPRKSIHLFVSPPKKNSLDLILKQCVETGINSINFIKTVNSVAMHKGEKFKQQIINKLKEACKQAHNPFMPEVEIELKLSDLPEISKNYDALFFGSTENCSEHYATDHAFEQIKFSKNESLSKIGWLVGPEGGFSREEVVFLKEIGVRPLQLGQWVMRVETACTAGIVSLRNF